MVIFITFIYNVSFFLYENNSIEIDIEEPIEKGSRDYSSQILIELYITKGYFALLKDPRIS